MRLDPSRLYHHGIVVTNLEIAAATIAHEQGLTFTEPVTSVQRIRTAEGVEERTFRFVYSAEGPVHMELVQEMPGSLWVTNGGAGLHHLGYWSADIDADGAALEAGGMQRAFTHEPHDGQAARPESCQISALAWLR